MAGYSEHSVSDIDNHLQKPSCCYVCNGYYGPCFGEHICKTCHLFLYSQELGQCVQEDTMVYFARASQNQEQVSSIHCTPSHGLARQLQLLSDMRAPLSQTSDGDGDYFKDLPPELLIIVFSYLDDFSLWCVSQVCTRWNYLSRSQMPLTWNKFVTKYWPLYKPLNPFVDWYSVNSALINSSSCISCVRRMFNHPYDKPLEHMKRIPSFQNKLNRISKGSPPDGIRAVPLDIYSRHWQAMILGPDGSPFEGGTFFLYIQIPDGFPIEPSVIRFITKIFHPNISRHGDIGIDILHHYHSPAYYLSHVLLSIQLLLTNPYCDVCMEPDIARVYNNDRQLYNNIARLWTRKFAMI